MAAPTTSPGGEDPDLDLDLGQTVRGLQKGLRVFSRYTLDCLLGRGGMGVVWLARDERLKREVALKFLPEHLPRDEVAMDDLKRETNRCLDLTHPGIVRIYDLVEDGHFGAIAMEYVEGRTLSTLRLDKPNRVFEVDELRPWVRQICEALAYAHDEARVAHRDIKPSNLMLHVAGRIKVADFGISSSLSDSMSRHSRAAATSGGGTLPYMCPQQALGYPASVSDDVYSLGATLYELLTGKPPFFRGDLIRQIEVIVPVSLEERRRELRVEGAAPIPEVWEAIIAGCLEKEPSRRPATMRELSERLTGEGAADSEQSGGGRTPAALLPKPRTEAAPEGASESVPSVPVATAGDSPGGDASLTGVSAARRVPIGLLAGLGVLLIAGIAGLIHQTSRPEVAAGVSQTPSAAVPTQTPVPTEPVGVPEAGTKGALLMANQPDTGNTLTSVPSVVPAEEPVTVGSRFDQGRAGSTLEVEIGDGLGITLCHVPAGRFIMGSPDSEEGRRGDEAQVEVTLSKGFWLGQTEVTEGLWQAVMEDSTMPPVDEFSPQWLSSWDETQEFLGKLNAMNLLPAEWEWNLPTEAQWEYACRAGTSDPYAGELDSIAWYDDGETRYGPEAVGGKRPNAWGLHDMHGNVTEWCRDWYLARLAGGVDPAGPPVGTRRVVRGGQHDSEKEHLRSAARDFAVGAYDYQGIRLAVVRKDQILNHGMPAGDLTLTALPLYAAVRPYESRDEERVEETVWMTWRDLKKAVKAKDLEAVRTAGAVFADLQEQSHPLIAYQGRAGVAAVEAKLKHLEMGSAVPRVACFKPVLKLSGGSTNDWEWDPEKSGNFGFIDQAGKAVTPFLYEEAGDFEEGLAPVKIDGKWGYIDPTGAMVIEPRWETAERFAEGLAAVSEGGKYGFIDRLGQVVIPLQWGEVRGGFIEGFASVGWSGLQGLIDREGKLVLPIEWSQCIPRGEGVIEVWNTSWGQWDQGGLNLRGEEIISIGDSHYVNHVVDGFIPIGYGTSPGLYRRDGAKVWEAKGMGTWFGEGPVPYEDASGLMGYRAVNGADVIKPTWPRASGFLEGLARVGKDFDEDIGFIELSGAVVIPATWDSASAFSEDRCLVKRGGSYGYIDKVGRTVVPFVLQEAGSFKDNLARAFQIVNDSTGEARMVYLSPSGEVVWSSDGSTGLQ